REAPGAPGPRPRLPACGAGGRREQRGRAARVPPPNLLQAGCGDLPGAEGADGARAAPAAQDRGAAPACEGHRPAVNAEAVARDVPAIREQGFAVVPSLVSCSYMTVMQLALRPARD